MRVGITGSTGYVGQRVVRALERHGHSVVTLGRGGSAGAAPGIAFTLGQEVAADALRGIDALIHAAHDRQPASWSAVHEVNVLGSRKLFVAAHAAGVRVVFVSSAAAFAGTRSLYGRAKLEVEGFTLDHGGAVVRPGLVHGSPPGGLFRALLRVTRLPVVPLVGGKQRFHTCHVDDLAEALCELIGRPAPREPVGAAHAQPLEFADVLRILAEAQGHRARFVRIPASLALGALHCAELLGVRLGLQRDSLVGLLHRNPSYRCDFDYTTPFRPLTVETALA